MSSEVNNAMIDKMLDEIESDRKSRGCGDLQNKHMSPFFRRKEVNLDDEESRS